MTYIALLLFEAPRATFRAGADAAATCSAKTMPAAGMRASSNNKQQQVGIQHTRSLAGIFRSVLYMESHFVSSALKLFLNTPLAL
jgi:hypothetical protein